MNTRKIYLILVMLITTFISVVCTAEITFINHSDITIYATTVPLICWSQYISPNQNISYSAMGACKTMQVIVISRKKLGKIICSRAPELSKYNTVIIQGKVNNYSCTWK